MKLIKEMWNYKPNMISILLLFLSFGIFTVLYVQTQSDIPLAEKQGYKWVPVPNIDEQDQLDILVGKVVKRAWRAGNTYFIEFEDGAVTSFGNEMPRND